MVLPQAPKHDFQTHQECSKITGLAQESCVSPRREQCVVMDEAHFLVVCFPLRPIEVPPSPRRHISKSCIPSVGRRRYQYHKLFPCRGYALAPFTFPGICRSICLWPHARRTHRAWNPHARRRDERRPMGSPSNFFFLIATVFVWISRAMFAVRVGKDESPGNYPGK